MPLNAIAARANIKSLYEQVTKTDEYMKSTINDDSVTSGSGNAQGRHPSALEIATYAVVLLEDHPLFNSGHGSVFTRDGRNELEASVMVSRGFKKRGVGVMGLRNVRNPILLARKMLEHGDQDLQAKVSLEPTTKPQPQAKPRRLAAGSDGDLDVDAPSAQGHTLIYGAAAEKLAASYGCELVDQSYFFTQKRWDEHVDALEQERLGCGLATWDAEEYLPQGTCGAVAMDENGVICAATSTGGLTNKVSGRVGDTPVPGCGFWADEWTEAGDPTGSRPTSELDGKGMVARRSMGVSGTGTGDSFVRIAAARTVAGMAQWMPIPSAEAVTRVAGANGTLQQSAQERWGTTGEGEGGMIGIEAVALQNADGEVVARRSEILMDCNCAGMYRAWIDDSGKAVMSIWSNGEPDQEQKVL